MEEKKGKDFLLAQLQKNATEKAFLAKMKYEPHERGDVLFLTGVGKVYADHNWMFATSKGTPLSPYKSTST